MRHEGLGAHPSSSCETCGEDSASYRCLDCFSRGLSCEQCIVHQHANHPLHEIQVNHFPYSVPTRLIHSPSGGTAVSSPEKPCLTWVCPINSATTLTIHAFSPPLQSASRSSISQASTPSGLPIVFVTIMVYPAIVASNFSVFGGFWPPGPSPALFSPSVFSISPTNFKRGLRSTSMISTLLSCQ